MWGKSAHLRKEESKRRVVWEGERGFWGGGGEKGGVEGKGEGVIGGEEEGFLGRRRPPPSLEQTARREPCPPTAGPSPNGGQRRGPFKVIRRPGVKISPFWGEMFTRGGI